MLFKTVYTCDEIAPGHTVKTIGGTAKVDKGDVYRAFDGVSSLVGPGVSNINGHEEKGNLTIKSAGGFDNDLALAYQAYDIWKSKGYKGAPSSPASFFRQAMINSKHTGQISTRVYASANIIRKHICGGWIESFCRGYNYEKIYHYDLNKAYLGAISERGLPSRLYPYQKGLPHFVVKAKNIRGNNLPSFFTGKNGSLITSEDLESFPIKSFDVEYGVSFRDYDINLNQVVYSCADMPDRLFKRLTQAYWGVFAMRDPVEVEYRSGKNRSMYNYMQNIAWAQIIIRRVSQRVYRAATGRQPVSVYVDSVLCEVPLEGEEIGSDPGTWKHVDTYKQGVYMLAPGMWNPLPFNPKTLPKVLWKKHAGVS